VQGGLRALVAVLGEEPEEGGQQVGVEGQLEPSDELGVDDSRVQGDGLDPYFFLPAALVQLLGEHDVAEFGDGVVGQGVVVLVVAQVLEVDHHLAAFADGAETGLGADVDDPALLGVLELVEQERSEVEVPQVVGTDLALHSVLCHGELREAHDAGVVDQDVDLEVPRIHLVRALLDRLLAGKVQQVQYHLRVASLLHDLVPCPLAPLLVPAEQQHLGPHRGQLFRSLVPDPRIGPCNGHYLSSQVLALFAVGACRPQSYESVEGQTQEQAEKETGPGLFNGAEGVEDFLDNIHLGLQMMMT
jgi:hypothetical protein